MVRVMMLRHALALLMRSVSYRYCAITLLPVSTLRRTIHLAIQPIVISLDLVGAH
jgi:hypothetical protein